jgi:hypothetical protein
MDTITRNQYEAAYQIGLELHDSNGALGIVDAKKRLAPTKLNPNNAADLIHGVGHLLRGECYKRKLSEEVLQSQVNPFVHHAHTTR